MAKTRPGVASSKSTLGKKDIDSYTIRGTNKVVRAGDCVLMRPSDAGKPPYVARVEKIEADPRNNVKVHCRWYYRPEESLGEGDSSMEPKSSSCLITTMFKVHTPLKENASYTPLKTIPGLRASYEGMKS